MRKICVFFFYILVYTHRNAHNIPSNASKRLCVDQNEIQFKHRLAALNSLRLLFITKRQSTNNIN